MKIETLKVTKKIIRKAGYGRLKKTYFEYIIENNKHKYKLKTKEGTKLFNMLNENPIYKNTNNSEIIMDGVFKKNKFLYVKNFRLIK